MAEEVAATIIVSTRNRAEYLSDCLQSLARQDCNAFFEILIIDNGSTDDTPRVIDEWRGKDPRFRTFRETRVGLSAAKNAGARLATGRLLLFTDDDVIVPPNWIRAYIDLFTRVGGEEVLAGGPIVPVLNDLSPWPDWFDKQGLAEVGLLDYNAERRLGRFEYVWGANMAIPASLFRKIGLWNESLGRRGDERGTFEDTEYQDRVKAAGGKVWFCPAAGLKHRIERETVRPRRVMETAFTRGRNEFCMPIVVSHGSMDNAPRSNSLASLTALVVTLNAWLFWTVVFRVARTRSVFCRTRAAAFASGGYLERMRAGRKWSLFSRTLSRATFLLREVILSFTPDHALKR